MTISSKMKLLLLLFFTLIICGCSSSFHSNSKENYKQCTPINQKVVNGTYNSIKLKKVDNLEYKVSSGSLFFAGNEFIPHPDFIDLTYDSSTNNLYVMAIVNDGNRYYYKEFNNVRTDSTNTLIIEYKEFVKSRVHFGFENSEIKMKWLDNNSILLEKSTFTFSFVYFIFPLYFLTDNEGTLFRVK